MPVVRITDATWGRLKRWAVPLEDTIDDAIRKVLDVAERVKHDKRPPEGHGTPEDAFRHPILESLQKLGGSASTRDVLNMVEEKLKASLTVADYAKLVRSGQVRRRNTAKWAGKRLRDAGLLKPVLRRGIWELSAKGREELETIKGKASRILG